MNKRRRILKFISHWIALVVLGWLTYALVRGLLAIIYLGVPFYDWQWYLPIIAVLMGLPVYILWSRSRSGKRLIRRSAVVIFTVLLYWIVIGYGGFEQLVHLSLTNNPVVPISFWAFSDFRQTPDTIPEDIQATHGAIYLDAGSRPLEGGGREVFVTAMRRLAAYNIPVYWAVSTPNFLSVPVATQWTDNVCQAARLVSEENLIGIHGFIGDVEPPMN